jgi:hypothetical protein
VRCPRPTTSGSPFRSWGAGRSSDVSDWFDEGSAGSGVDLPALLDSHVVDAILDVVGAGALVSLGVSRDGGAVGVTVTSDGRWRRDWFRESEPLAVWLRGAFTSIVTPATQPSSSARGSRSRPRRGGQKPA